MRLLIFGGTGQVGAELRALVFPHDIELVAPTRAEADLTDAKAIVNLIAAEPWTAVINAAAYTEVDRAEREEAAAFAINAAAPSHLAVETARRAIPLVHISTDYVFDGRKGEPYVESDNVAPLNAYGRSKLAGERAVASANPRHIILRTSWVYSPYRNNFVRTILRLIAERDTLSIVADQRGCPTVARDIAKACLEIALRCAAQPEYTPYGVYHFAAQGEATWFEFARTIIDIAGDRVARSPHVIPIKTSEYPTLAARAADTRLDSTAVFRAFGVKARPWHQALKETVEQLMAHKVIP